MPPKSLKKKGTVVVVVPKKKNRTPKIAVVNGQGDYRPTSFQRVRGRGDYLGDVLGNLGRNAGNAAQSMFRDITGFGDYRSRGPKHNSLLSLVSKAADTREGNLGSSPSTDPFQMGAMSVKFGGSAPRVQHREFIGPILAPGNTLFTTQVFRIQPGLSGVNSLFPWGSSVAKCFRQYVLHGMILEYVTTSTNFASSSALGSVQMSTVYDAEQTPLASLAEVDNNEYTTSAAPSTSFYHPIECAPGAGATQVKYVQNTNTVSGSDARFDDVGTFQVSLNGITAPAGTQLGQLWASYDLEFSKAELPDLHLGTTALFTSSASAIGGGVLTANPNNSLPATALYSGGVITVSMPAGYNGSYLASLHFESLGTGNVSYAIQNQGSELTALTLFRGNNGLPQSVEFAGVSPTNGFTLTYAFSTIAVSTGGNNSFAVSLSSAVTGYTTLLIAPLDNDLSTPLSYKEWLRRGRPQRVPFEHSTGGSWGPDPAGFGPASSSSSGGLSDASGLTSPGEAYTSPPLRCPVRPASVPSPPSSVVSSPTTTQERNPGASDAPRQNFRLSIDEDYTDLGPQPPSIDSILANPKYAHLKRLIMAAGDDVLIETPYPHRAAQTAPDAPVPRP